MLIRAQKQRSAKEVFITFDCVKHPRDRFSYTIVAFHIAWASLEQASLLQRRWLPGGWSPIGIFLSLILRGAFLPFGTLGMFPAPFRLKNLRHSPRTSGQRVIVR